MNFIATLGPADKKPFSAIVGYVRDYFQTIRESWHAFASMTAPSPACVLPYCDGPALRSTTAKRSSDTHESEAVPAEMCAQQSGAGGQRRGAAVRGCLAEEGCGAAGSALREEDGHVAGLSYPPPCPCSRRT